MVEIVFAHGGTLDKLIGDALMALWGTPLASDDDPDRAVAAAIALQRALLGLNARWAAQGRRTLSVGIGLSFGEVFAGNIGSDRRLDLTVIGDEVNLAAHLCSHAGPEEILTTEPLFAALRRPPPAVELPPLTFKGRTQAVRVYRAEWREERGKTEGGPLSLPPGGDGT
jgi:adenylate cyclase